MYTIVLKDDYVHTIQHNNNIDIEEIISVTFGDECVWQTYIEPPKKAGYLVDIYGEVNNYDGQFE